MLKRLDSATHAEFDAAPSAEPAAQGFDLHEAINFAWRQWKFILALVVLALFIGQIYVARQTPLYTATAELLLQAPKGPPGALLSDPGTSEILNAGGIESQIQIIKSTALLKRVVMRERLVNDAEFGAAPTAPAGPGLLGSIRNFFLRSREDEVQKPASPEGKGDSNDASPEVISTVQNLRGAVGVQRNGAGWVLDISVISVDPAKAARLANAIADAYVVDKLDARFEAVKRASSWLSDRLVELRSQLRESEEAVAKFRADNDLPAGGAGNATLNQEQLGHLNARLVEARALAAEKKALLDLLVKVQTDGGANADLPGLGDAGAIPDLRKQLDDLKRQEADLLSRYTDRHPAVVNVHAQIADVRRSITVEAGRLAANVKNDYSLALARQQAVEMALRDATGQTGLDATKSITLRELDRNVAVNKALFEDFLQRSKVSEQQETYEARDVRLITPALPPGGPSSPQKSRVLITSLILGLMAGVGGAYLIEMLNAGFTTQRQVEELIGLPLLASISKMQARDLTADGVTMTMPEYPHAKPLSRFSESVRSLRSAIAMSDVDNPPKVLLLTSALPGEGKTTIAITLASSAAQSGQRVLVVDADLRHPSASRYVKADKAAGLVDYLVGGEELDKVIVFDDRLKLWAMPSGAKTQNPPDLLGSDRFKTLIASLREKFDLVVIDAPPTGPVVDPLIVAQVADKVVFVVRWAKTAREMVVHSIERIAGHKKVAGVVFNLVIDAEARKYGRYAYSYYYGGRYYRKYYDE